MKALAVLNTVAGARHPSLPFNLGWMLADAGFRVLLVDLDPQAGLSRLAGATAGSRPSVESLVAGDEQVDPAELVHEIRDNLLLIPGDIMLTSHEDDLAAHWAGTLEGNDGDAKATARLQRHVHSFAEDLDADFVICDLPSSLGPLTRAGALVGDGLVVQVAADDVAARGLTGIGRTLGRWRTAWLQATQMSAFSVYGYVLVDPDAGERARSSQIRHGIAAAFRKEIALAAATMASRDDEDPGCLGRIKVYPGIMTIAREAGRPELALRAADGVAGAYVYAVRDVETQYAALAGRLLEAARYGEDDAFIEKVEGAVFGALADGLPPELDSLSSHTSVADLADVEVGRLAVSTRGIRVAGTATVGVDLGWGGSREGVEMTASFPMRFDVELDRSRTSVSEVHDLTVDTSSFYA